MTATTFDPRAYGDRVRNDGKGNGAARPPLQFLSAAEFVAGYVPPSYLVGGILQRQRLYGLTANTGHGKTAVELLLAALISGAAPHPSLPVMPGRCLFLAGENPDDLKGRAILVQNRMGFSWSDLRLEFVENAFNVATAFPEIEARAKHHGGMDCIFVDTAVAFLAASGYTNENDNLEMLRFARDLRTLTELPGKPAVVVSCHPIKNASRENLIPRGGGATLNEIDGNFTLWAEGERETTEFHWQGKLRGPTFDPITFALEKGTCPGLVDAEGRSIPSVWAYPTTSERAERAEERQRADEDSLLLVMAARPAGSFADWARGLGWTLENGDPAKQRVQRAINRLAAEKLTTKKRGLWTLTKSGEAEAERLRGGVR